MSDEDSCDFWKFIGAMSLLAALPQIPILLWAMFVN